MMQMESCQVMLFKYVIQYLNQHPVKLLPSQVDYINWLPTSTSSVKCLNFFLFFLPNFIKRRVVLSMLVDASRLDLLSSAANKSSLTGLLAIVQLMHACLKSKK